LKIFFAAILPDIIKIGQQLIWDTVYACALQKFTT